MDRNHLIQQIFGPVCRVDQVKESHRIALDAGFSYNEQNFTIDGDNIKSLRRSQYAGAHFVKSINDHWSWGVFNNVFSSIFNNLDFQYSSQPGIEYNIFPYSESSRQQLRFTYQAGIQHNFYNDTTIYSQTEELMPMHNLGSCLSGGTKVGDLLRPAFVPASFYMSRSFITFACERL